jgi:hypothetical protein
MRVVLKDAVRKVKYPYIGINEYEVVILFQCQKTGIVLNGGSSGYRIGHTSTAWSEENFRPMQGSITLSND